MRRLLLLLLMLLSPIALFASAGDGIWRDSTLAAKGVESSALYYRPLLADPSQLANRLSYAPQEFTSTQGSLLSLPMPYGGYQQFRVEVSSVMAPELAARYPEIKTYRAISVDDPTITARLDVTPKGFHAMIDMGGDTIFIDPDGSTDRYRSYYKRDYALVAKGGLSAEGFTCKAHSLQQPITPKIAGKMMTRTGDQLRTYRLAVAATGEYTQFHGSRIAAMAEIVTAINRVNQIFGRDLAIGFQLVARNDTIIYLDAQSDPYDNDDPYQMLDDNQSNLDAVIGSANYDIGHVFGTTSGGLAVLNSSCNRSWKAQGVTGLANPAGDPFYINFLSHEIGHQMGSPHTFNGTASHCGSGNKITSSAYEPGSGSTIMAYAGICGSENVQMSSDAVFHAGSIALINAHVAGSGACYSRSATGNVAPTVSAGAHYTIPKGTPFILSGSATDPDPGDLLSYQWDEMDAGSSVSGYGTDTGSNPLFRSFLPKDTAVRVLPRMSNLLNNLDDSAEFLPTTDRTLNFRLTVRDGHYGVDGDDTVVTSDSDSGPFRITALNGYATYLTTDTPTLTWDVANTTAAPVSCANVDIELLTFNADASSYCAHMLADDTPNDGSEVLAIPDRMSVAARFRVMCSDNIFFDISDADIDINSATPAPTNCVSTDGAALEHGADYVVSDPELKADWGTSSKKGGGGAFGLWLLSLLVILVRRVV